MQTKLNTAKRVLTWELQMIFYKVDNAGAIYWEEIFVKESKTKLDAKNKPVALFGIYAKKDLSPKTSILITGLALTGQESDRLKYPTTTNFWTYQHGDKKGTSVCAPNFDQITEFPHVALTAQQPQNKLPNALLMDDMLIIVDDVLCGEEITYWYGSTTEPAQQQNKTNITTKALQIWAANKCEQLGLSDKWKRKIEKQMPHINIWRKKLSWQMKRVQQNLYLRRQGYISTNRRPTSKRIPRQGFEATIRGSSALENSRSPSAESQWNIQGQFTGSKERRRKWKQITNRSDTLSYGEEEKFPPINSTTGETTTQKPETDRDSLFGNQNQHENMDSDAFEQLSGAEPVGFEPITHSQFSDGPAFVRHCIKDLVDSFMKSLGMDQINYNVGDMIAAFVADPMVKPQNQRKKLRTEKETRPEGGTPSRGDNE
jgi:hypothetical protein